jgi:membrane-associated protein
VFAPVDAWLREHLYAVVLAGAVVDAVGIPFPGRIVLITAGSVSGAATEQGAKAAIVIALATVGTVAGDHVWYLLGRLYGRRLFHAYGRLMRLSEAKLKAADRLLRRFGGLALVIARLAATLRLFVVPLAVSRGMSYRRFLVFDLIGALVWSAGFVWLGWVAGALGARSGLTATLTAISGLFLASVVLTMVVRHWLARRVRVS